MSQVPNRDTDPADYQRAGRAVRPKLAATLILLRETKGEPQFLMGKRAMGHRFMPGKFVFPGGRVDRQDGRAPVGSDICPDMLQTMAGYVPERKARALACAAIRETYEETGLKLAVSSSFEHKIPSAFQAFGDHQLGLDLGALSLLARAITPPYHPKRFDTWFFTARADTLIDDPADLASGELEELQWVTFAQASKLDLPTITRFVLRDLQEASGQNEPLIPFYHTKKQRHIRSVL